LNKTILELKATHKELQEAYLDTIYRLVLAAEYRDEDTGDHIVRMSRYCALIAENILMKPGKLTDEEFEIIKTHSTIGAKILANSKAEILKVAEQIALSHHEKWNGNGYPQGLSGDNIPLAGRIVGLADAFDAITSKRPYKDPYPVEMACDIIKKERGEHFDPDLVDVFMENIDEVLKIKAEVHLEEGLSLADFTKSERDQLEEKGG
jgi:putative two-component system response regulator